MIIQFLITKNHATGEPVIKVNFDDCRRLTVQESGMLTTKFEEIKEWIYPRMEREKILVIRGDCAKQENSDIKKEKT